MELQVAIFGLIGVLIGSVISLLGTKWITDSMIKANRRIAEHTYLIGLMQQLIEARSEFIAQVAIKDPKDIDLAQPVAKAFAISRALGYSADATKDMEDLAIRGQEADTGLQVIDHTINMLSARLNPISGKNS